MVVSRCRRYLDRTGPRIPQRPILDLQRLDVHRPRFGLDQYPDHFGCGLLRGCNSNWDRETLAWKRSDGPAPQARPRQLPSRTNASAGITSQETILSERGAVSS
jgi:hypothetical protein